MSIFPPYIVLYLFKCINYIDKFNQQFLNFDKIVRVINGSGKNKFRAMIKIYVFKIVFYLINKNYYHLRNYLFLNKGLTFYDDFKDKFKENKEAILNYYIIPFEEEEYDKYVSLFDRFDNERNNNFSNPVKEIKELIERNGPDIFFAVSTNIVISNICLNNNIDHQEYKIYSSYIKNLFGQVSNLPVITKKLFFLFSNEEDFNNIIKKKLEKEKQNREEEEEEEGENNRNIISSKCLEILLYSLRFCIQTSFTQNYNGFFYSQLLSPECKQTIERNCIPGNNLLNNIYVNNYQKIEEHLNTQPSDRGIYVCSCGLSYIIESCGFPCPPENENEEKNKFLCKNSNCKEQIGYAPPPIISKNVIHGMVMRKGHYRIFKDEKQKMYEMNLYGDSDINIQSMLLKDYKNKKIQPFLENSKFGINIIPKIFFKQINLKVRNLSQIGYRLLNFILYSHLFFTNCLGFLSEDELKNKYLCDGMTCEEMIMTNWDILKENLETKYGIRIQIFMNLIFNKLSAKLKRCQLIRTNDEREQFENEIEEIIKDVIKKYPEQSKIYIERNIKGLQLNKDSMRSLVLENFDMSLYDGNEYPFYKYFSMTTYPSEKKLIQELYKIADYEKKYPLLNAYLNIIKEQVNDENIIKREQTTTIKLLNFLPIFNDFSNLMIDIYSYKISREEASQMKIENEPLYIQNQGKFQDSLKRFIKIWNKISPYATQYENEILPQKNFGKETFLIYFLNDCEGNGRYIAAAYQTFIKLQNNFLDGLIEPLRESPILNHFVKNIEKKIDVQKASKAEILNFEAIENFSELIYENCKRNIFLDNKINYINYQKFIFNFDAIERDLGEKLLPNITRFKKDLKFVTYCFEGFKNKNSILIMYEKCYEQKKMDLPTKQKIYDYLIAKNRENNDTSSYILRTIDILMYYLIQEKSDSTEVINKIIKELPYYVNLYNEGLDFFNKYDIKVEELLDAYVFIELVSFEYLVKNLKNKYKTNEIDENIKNQLDEFEFSIINKKNLCSACRKVITRFLINTVEDNDGNENILLDLYLNKEDLWDKEVWKNNELLKKDLNKLKDLKITIGQCYKLYNILKGNEEDKEIELEGIVVSKNDEDNKIDSSDLNIKPKPRPRPRPRGY